MYLSPKSIIDDPLGLEATVPGGLLGFPWKNRDDFPLAASMQRLQTKLMAFEHFDSRALGASATRALQQRSGRWLEEFRAKAPSFPLEATWNGMGVSRAFSRDVAALDDKALKMFVNLTAWCFSAEGTRSYGLFNAERIARVTGLGTRQVEKLIEPVSFEATCPVCASSAAGTLKSRVVYSSRWPTRIVCPACSHAETLVRRPDDQMRLLPMLKCSCSSCALARRSALDDFLGTYEGVLEECANVLWVWTSENLDDLYLHPQRQLSCETVVQGERFSAGAYETAKALLSDKCSLSEALMRCQHEETGSLQCLIARGVGHGWLRLVGGRLLRGEEGHRASIEFIGYGLKSVTASVNRLRTLSLQQSSMPGEVACIVTEIQRGLSDLSFMLPSLVTVKWSDFHNTAVRNSNGSTTSTA